MIYILAVLSSFPKIIDYRKIINKPENITKLSNVKKWIVEKVLLALNFLVFGILFLIVKYVGNEWSRIWSHGYAYNLSKNFCFWLKKKISK